MINYASSPPPEELIIDGVSYPIDTDYRTWIAVTELFKKLTDNNDAEIWDELQNLIFGGEVDCNIEQALNEIVTFMLGYPEYDNGNGGSDSKDHEPVYSFIHDINMIVLAIRNQSGIDISYNCQHFHWWLFLLEFKSLEERHYISWVMNCRNYNGEDKERLKLKKTFALPIEYTEEEKQQAQELNNIFYDC